MGNENNYEEFLEGQYDECIPLRALQEAQDNHRAAELAKTAEKKMEDAWESEEERIAKAIDGRGMVLEEVMNAYLEEDKFYQYLVDGATLQCDQATLDNFDIPNEGQVILEKVTDQSDEERCQMKLRVSENVQDDDPKSIQESSMSLGGRAYATVKDTVKYRNIMVPCCNCKRPLNRVEEAERIKADPDINKHGVCRHLMQLNDEWRNFWRPGQSYLSKTNRAPSAMTVGFGEVGTGNHFEEAIGGEPETVPGITMTSMLFCKHGGMIMPVRSGQERKKGRLITGVSEELITLLKSYETGEDQNGNLLKEGEPALQTYQGKADKEGVHTIAWGHAMVNEKDGEFSFDGINEVNLYELGTQITLEQAEKILEADIAFVEGQMNKEFHDRRIWTQVDQQFYDALFLLLYQNGTGQLTGDPNHPEDETDLSRWLTRENFDLNDEQEIKEQFGEYTNNNSAGAKLRRMDELDIIFYGDYNRDEGDGSLNRYGDIWAKKTERKKAEENQ